MAFVPCLFLTIIGGFHQQRVLVHGSRLLPGLSSPVRPAPTPSNLVTSQSSRFVHHSSPLGNDHRAGASSQRQSAGIAAMAGAALSVSRLPVVRNVAKHAAMSKPRVRVRFARANVARHASESAGEAEQSETPSKQGRLSGTCVHWFAPRGAGFIKIPTLDADIFVDFRSIEGEGFRYLVPGQQVEVELATGTSRPIATRVIPGELPEERALEPDAKEATEENVIALKAAEEAAKADVASAESAIQPAEEQLLQAEIARKTAEQEAVLAEVEAAYVAASEAMRTADEKEALRQAAEEDVGRKATEESLARQSVVDATEMLAELEAAQKALAAAVPAQIAGAEAARKLEVDLTWSVAEKQAEYKKAQDRVDKLQKKLGKMSALRRNFMKVNFSAGDGTKQRFRISGTVLRWYGTKGFGFIRPEGTKNVKTEMFVHHSSIQGEGFHALYPGQHVEFEPDWTDKERPRAVNVNAGSVPKSVTAALLALEKPDRVSQIVSEVTWKEDRANLRLTRQYAKKHLTAMNLARELDDISKTLKKASKDSIAEEKTLKSVEEEIIQKVIEEETVRKAVEEAERNVVARAEDRKAADAHFELMLAEEEAARKAAAEKVAKNTKSEAVSKAALKESQAYADVSEAYRVLGEKKTILRHLEEKRARAEAQEEATESAKEAVVRSAAERKESKTTSASKDALEALRLYREARANMDETSGSRA